MSSTSESVSTTRSATSAVAAFILFASSLAGFAQTDTSLKHPVTDQQKLADALRAGPAFVAKDALILDCQSEGSES